MTFIHKYSLTLKFFSKNHFFQNLTARRYGTDLTSTTGDSHHHGPGSLSPDLRTHCEPLRLPNSLASDTYVLPSRPPSPMNRGSSRMSAGSGMPHWGPSDSDRDRRSMVPGAHDADSSHWKANYSWPAWYGQRPWCKSLWHDS